MMMKREMFVDRVVREDTVRGRGSSSYQHARSMKGGNLPYFAISRCKVLM
jgi:hypothetical protein